MMDTTCSPTGLRNLIDAVHEWNEREIIRYAEFISTKTQSPIETLLWLALIRRTECEFKMETLIGRTDKPFLKADLLKRRSALMVITPQAQILNCRVDFLIHAVSAEAIVECDGHEFHERTPLQAERDRKRDRDFQANGYRVFRFTGTEITRHAWNCADEVIDWAVRLHSTMDARKAAYRDACQKSTAARG